MKKSELKQLIKEEIRKVISENETYADRITRFPSSIGSPSKEDEIDLIHQSGVGGEKKMTYKIHNVKKTKPGATLSVTTYRYPSPFPIEVYIDPYTENPSGLNVRFYGDRMLARTEKDAVKLIDVLKQNGISGNFNPKLFTYKNFDSWKQLYRYEPYEKTEPLK